MRDKIKDPLYWTWTKLPSKNTNTGAALQRKWRRPVTREQGGRSRKTSAVKRAGAPRSAMSWRGEPSVKKPPPAPGWEEDSISSVLPGSFCMCGPFQNSHQPDASADLWAALSPAVLKRDALVCRPTVGPSGCRRSPHRPPLLPTVINQCCCSLSGPLTRCLQVLIDET